MLETVPALSTASPPSRKRARPKGLWKGRVTAAPRFLTSGVHDRQPDNFHWHDSDTDNDELDINETQPSLKYRRGLTLDTEEIYYWDYSRRRSPGPPEQVSSSNRRTKIMDNTTTARPGAQTSARTSFDYEDWEDLKDLFARATERYESSLS